MLFYASFNMRKITFILVYKALVLTSNNHTHRHTQRLTDRQTCSSQYSTPLWGWGVQQQPHMITICHSSELPLLFMNLIIRAHSFVRQSTKFRCMLGRKTQLPLHTK